MVSKALIIPAAGSGKRMQHKLAKPFIVFNGQAILAHTLSRFINLKGLEQIIVATSADYQTRTDEILQQVAGGKVHWQRVDGGAERQYSVHAALKSINDTDLVMIHDAVRPFVSLDLIRKCCSEALKTGAAIPGIPSKDTIKKIDENNFIESTPDRRQLWQVQTPQIFQTSLLKRAFHRAEAENYLGTDDASLVEWLGEPVKVIRGDHRNFKITYPHDLELAQFYAKTEDN